MKVVEHFRNIAKCTNDGDLERVLNLIDMIEKIRG